MGLGAFVAHAVAGGVFVEVEPIMGELFPLGDRLGADQQSGAVRGARGVEAACFLEIDSVNAAVLTEESDQVWPVD